MRAVVVGEHSAAQAPAHSPAAPCMQQSQLVRAEPCPVCWAVPDEPTVFRPPLPLDDDRLPEPLRSAIAGGLRVLSRISATWNPSSTYWLPGLQAVDKYEADVKASGRDDARAQPRLGALVAGPSQGCSLLRVARVGPSGFRVDQESTREARLRATHGWRHCKAPGRSSHSAQHRHAGSLWFDNVLPAVHLCGVKGVHAHNVVVLQARQQLALPPGCHQLAALTWQQVNDLHRHQLRVGVGRGDREEAGGWVALSITGGAPGNMVCVPTTLEAAIYSCTHGTGDADKKSM